MERYTHPLGSPRLLNAPTRQEYLRTVVELSRPMATFFEDTMGFGETAEDIAEHQAIQDKLSQTSDFDLLDVAVEVISNVLCEGGKSHGISYTDIAALRKQGVIRSVLFPNFDSMLYNPEPSQTESYHLNVLESQMAQAIGIFYGTLSNHVDRDSLVDRVVWRVLTEIVMDLSTAVAVMGQQKGLSPSQLMAYHFDKIDPYGHGRAEYTYVVTLKST